MPGGLQSGVMTLDEWITTVAGALDLGEVSGESGTDVAAVRAELLDLARDAAHGIARPAAPLTTFLLGVAVGRGGGLAANAAAIRALIPATEPGAGSTVATSTGE